MLRAAHFPGECILGIKHHHERFDGKGYPNQLAGRLIPLIARVLAVVDSFDALTSDRPYREARSTEEGLEEIQKCAGSQFDPSVVRAFVRVVSASEDRHRTGNVTAA